MPCACPPRPRGPPWDDGSDLGPCRFCEEQSWRDEHGQHDEQLEAMINDHDPNTQEQESLYLHPSPEMGEWRPEVRAFADLMEAQLRANDHKPGWKDDTDLDLFERLGEASAELLAALHRNAKRLMWGDSWVMEDTVPRVGAEAADVANFAMMIADVCGALKLKENGLSREGLGGSACAGSGAACPSDCAEGDVRLSDGGCG